MLISVYDHTGADRFKCFIGSGNVKTFKYNNSKTKNLLVGFKAVLTVYDTENIGTNIFRCSKPNP